jgi:hypothetical protein
MGNRRSKSKAGVFLSFVSDGMGKEDMQANQLSNTSFGWTFFRTSNSAFGWSDSASGWELGKATQHMAGAPQQHLAGQAGKATQHLAAVAEPQQPHQGSAM